MPGEYVVQSLKRDFSFPITDAFGIFLDPMNNRTAGFSFAVSPAGVQREGLVQNAGQYGVTTSWDNKWFSEVKNYDDKWVVEIAIPFKTIRYDDSQTTWGINFARNDLKRLETSTWVPVPTQYNVASLGFLAALKWDAPPKKAGTNIAFIPYVSVGANKDYEATDDAAKITRPNAGFDAKIALNSSLNLDLTVNPDFSQVEVDRQVTNLERYSIFFPERRNFFLENSDLFRFGIGPMRPFFSRRIGLSSGSLIPIIAGARLTGNLNENWRLGAMSIQTEGVNNEDNGLQVQSQNYALATLQRKLWNRSYVTAYMLNRQAFDDFKMDKDDYHRMIGGEFVYRSADNKWLNYVQYHQSSSNYDGTKNGEELMDKNAIIGSIEYNGRNLFGTISMEYMAADYRPDVGYAQELFQRNDELGTTSSVPFFASLHYLGYRFYPEKIKNMRYWGVTYTQKLYADTKLSKLIDRWTDYNIGAVFTDNSQIDFYITNYAPRLFFPTNITFGMDSLLQPGTYKYTNAQLAYTSSKRYKLYGSLKTTYGGFYNGTIFSLNTELTYRLQPLGNFSLSVDYNNIDFPDGYGDSQLLLIGPRLEFTFTKSLFFTTFLQFNTQSDNFNINSRLQWRFAPMSDVFLVFTDNMYASDFSQKNWGIVLKASYWLAL